MKIFQGIIGWCDPHLKVISLPSHQVWNTLFKRQGQVNCGKFRIGIQTSVCRCSCWGLTCWIGSYILCILTRLYLWMIRLRLRHSRIIGTIGLSIKTQIWWLIEQLNFNWWMITPSLFKTKSSERSKTSYQIIVDIGMYNYTNWLLIWHFRFMSLSETRTSIITYLI